MTAVKRWTDSAHETLDGLLQNLVAEGRLTARYGVEATPAQIVESSRELLLNVIERSLPLARVMDDSHLVLRAEGTAVHVDLPRLAAFNWLSVVAERTMRHLSRQLFNLSERASKRLGRGLDLRLTGIAPGSLYLGFSIADVPSDLLAAAGEPVLATIRDSVRKLPDTASHIGDESILPAIHELLPDPAQRDLSLEALLALSPTGKRGISAVHIMAPGTPSRRLSPRERLILKEALARPELRNRKPGAFVGSLHEIDLDTHRFQLRGVTGVGTLRCAIAPLTKAEGKALLGEWVRVEGEYETDRQGRPRLMLVQHAVPLPSAPQPSLLG